MASLVYNNNYKLLIKNKDNFQAANCKSTLLRVTMRAIMKPLYYSFGMFFLFLFPLSAAAKVKIRAWDERDREYFYIFTLDRKEERRLDARFSEVLEAYRIKTRKEIAEERGYVEEVYGAENYNMISLSRLDYMFFDDRFNRILFKNVDVNSVDDFEESP
jgi:hypothetical protein